ncbi:MAG: ral secretion pathway protein [Deltaproteobacteria bacterium]|nr:ral secretion pathway protein [Deltaproteobacteria bacterium]
MIKISNKYFWLFNLLFVAGAAWFVCQISILFIQDRLKTSPPLGPGQGSAFKAEKPQAYERYGTIPERNIFNPSERGLKLIPLGDRRAGKRPKNMEAAQLSSSGSLRLVGTVTSQSGRGWAILQEEKDRKQRLYPIHGRVDDGKIVNIARDKITIQSGGKNEVLALSSDKVAGSPPSKPTTSAKEKEAVQKLSTNRFVVNREDVVGMVGNINQFMTQARIKPHFVSGRPGGFAISEIVPGSFFEKIGLRNQDVIKKVNGQPVNKPEEIFQAYSQLIRDSNIELEIERNHQSEVLRYEIR